MSKPLDPFAALIAETEKRGKLHEEVYAGIMRTHPCINQQVVIGLLLSNIPMDRLQQMNTFFALTSKDPYIKAKSTLVPESGDCPECGSIIHFHEGCTGDETCPNSMKRGA